MNYTIREITKKDDAAVENVIRTCLIEYGANHEGTAWSDPDLCRFSEIYVGYLNKYWVAEDQNGKIVCGVGIGLLDMKTRLCELQKMYCLPEARGSGLADKLIETALDFAKSRYDTCYLETLDNMTRAQKFYEKHGFIRTLKPLIKTAHFACEVKYYKKLSK